MVYQLPGRRCFDDISQCEVSAVRGVALTQQMSHTTGLRGAPRRALAMTWGMS